MEGSCSPNAKAEPDPTPALLEGCPSNWFFRMSRVGFFFRLNQPHPLHCAYLYVIKYSALKAATQK